MFFVQRSVDHEVEQRLIEEKLPGHKEIFSIATERMTGSGFWAYEPTRFGS